MNGGGTLVVKDSRGNVRAFFGHVCGGDYLDMELRFTKSLDHFYKLLHESGFKEYGWD
jgi:hypothetical protein